MAFDFTTLPWNLGTVSFNGERYEILRMLDYGYGKVEYDLRSFKTGELQQMTYYKPEYNYGKGEIE